MHTRKLGLNGPEIPPIVLGGNVFGWTADETESFRILDRALGLGLDCIDTADVYSRWVPGHEGGESETVLGKWFSKGGRRNRVLLVTKFGLEMGEGKSGLSARYVAQAVENSLRRLQTDHIDFYLTHHDDPKTPIGETLEALDKLVKAGKVRWIGASNYTGARLAEAMETSAASGLAAFVCLQPHYNLLARQEFESDLLPMIEKYGLGVITYFSLAAGFLTGKYRREMDLSNMPRGRTIAAKYLNERSFAIVDALVEVAAALHSTPSSVALAWLLARPGVTAPIASVSRLSQLDDLAAAAALQLDAASLERLNQASNPA
jgi:aryl-alcohol dehydrogenase-like predicted oxidoreductase